MATSQSSRTRRRGEERVSAATVELRRCHGIEEFRACVALQKEVWNFTDAELVPLRMFVVADKVGGQVMGAFDGDLMVGFALSVPGTRTGHVRSEEHTSELQSRGHLVCRLLLEKKKKDNITSHSH